MDQPAQSRPLQQSPDLEPIFLAGLRQRFKSEVNRMTGGHMRALLRDHSDAEALSFPLSYLYAHRWLRRNVPESHRQDVLSAFRTPARGFLMDLLHESRDERAFLDGYISHLSGETAAATAQRRQLRELLARRNGDANRLADEISSVWRHLGLLEESHREAYTRLGQAERRRYSELLGDHDRERLRLVDDLPDPGGVQTFGKLGIIPAMGCPQTCRHCMFIWRPPMRNLPDPQPLLAFVNAHTENLLFTGGDLTNHLEGFHRAIQSMDRVSTFAILLNGDFARDPATAEEILGTLASAVRKRPAGWAKAQVLLQISFDELHQEVILDKNGRLKERIPVARIANIVECAVRHPEIQLCLLHKQNALNFSTDVFRRGVFGRLAQELGRRGHQIEILTSAPSPRHKRHPLHPQRRGAVLKDASFVLARYPRRPILFTSSTIDAYGRAATLDEGEKVRDPELLDLVVRGRPPAGEGLDTDLMFWLNGWVTLFSAVHICLGDFHAEGGERVLSRHRKDPLTAALRRFDRRLLDLYGEVRPDLQTRIDTASSPHQLFHTITEAADVRLHMTRRLAARD